MFYRCWMWVHLKHRYHGNNKTIAWRPVNNFICFLFVLCFHYWIWMPEMANNWLFPSAVQMLWTHILISDQGSSQWKGQEAETLHYKLVCPGLREENMWFVMRNLVHTAVFLKYFCLDPDAVFTLCRMDGKEIFPFYGLASVYVIWQLREVVW